MYKNPYQSMWETNIVDKTTVSNSPKSIRLSYHKDNMVSKPVVMSQHFYDGVLTFFSLVLPNGELYVEFYTRSGNMTSSGLYKRRSKIRLWHVYGMAHVGGMVCRYYI